MQSPAGALHGDSPFCHSVEGVAPAAEHPATGQLLRWYGGGIVIAMASRSRTDPTPDLFAASPKMSRRQRAVPEADMTPTNKPDYLLPRDLHGALMRLQDAEIDTLLNAVTDEARRRGRLPRPPEAQQSVKPNVPKAKRVSDPPVDAPPLSIGRTNAVRAAFMAGVKPSTISRQFGISQSAVKQVLAQMGRAQKS